MSEPKNTELVELYLELLELNKYSMDGDPYRDPTADAAVVRTMIRDWYTSYIEGGDDYETS